MIQESKKFTRFTLEQSDRRLVWEVPYEDVSSDDIMDAVKTIMIGMTFHPHTIETMCIDYLEALEKYEINKIE